jgi:hypothetical protein
MPSAKKPAAPARRSKTFTEPAALKRFNRSLEAAERALAELGKHAGRDAGQGARDLYKGVRTFVSSARRDSRKLAKALQRDFEQAEKLLTERTGGRASRTSTARSQAKPRAAATRTKRKAS